MVLDLSIQFIGTGGTSPSVSVEILNVTGTSPSQLALLRCATAPRESFVVEADSPFGISSKQVSRSILFDDPYAFVDIVVKTTNGTFVDWRATFEPCGYPCIQRFLPRDCDPLYHPEECLL